MKVRSKYICIFINGSVLYNSFSSPVDLQQLIEPAVQEEYLQVETPTGHVFIKVKQVRIMINVFKLRYPAIVFAQQFSQCSFSRTYVARNSYMFWFFSLRHNEIV